MKKDFTISTKIILREAKKRKINIKTLYPGAIAELQFKNHKEYLCHQYISKTTSVAHQICHNKDITRVILDKKNISVSKGKKFKSDQYEEAKKFIKTIRFPIVLKPTSASHGNCVFSNVKNIKEFEIAWNSISTHYFNIIVEERFEGKEYRILATPNKVIAVTHRVPANIVGDGIHNIQELINIKNSDPRRADDDSYSNPKKYLVKIKINDVVKNKLKKLKLTLNYIPKKNQQIFLCDTSNLSTGGDSIDYTDKIHKSVKEIAKKVIKSIPGLAYGGIDFLTTDVTKPQTKNSYIIVEVNESPGIFMHHYPFEGTERDAAKEIINIAFPETKK